MNRVVTIHWLSVLLVIIVLLVPVDVHQGVSVPKLDLVSYLTAFVLRIESWVVRQDLGF